MGAYEREILVAHLRDVCSVEMVCRKLKRQIEDCDRRIDKNVELINRKLKDPVIPKREDYKPTNNAGANIAAIIFVVVSILLGWGISRLLDTFFILIMGIGVAAFFVWLLIKKSIAEQKEANRRYTDAVKEYKKEVKKIKDSENQMPARQARIKHLRKIREGLVTQLRKAQKIRNEVYAVNVIPTQHRDVYSIYYLYDYFNTSKETDLEKIIQTLQSSEIKQRWKAGIRQNEEIILNERKKLALQKDMNGQIVENYVAEMKRIASVEKDQKLQLLYQQMIAKNQLVTNFFIEADF